MEVVIATDAAAGAHTVAAAICRLVAGKPDAVLGVATGSTPEPVYECLVGCRRDENASFDRVTAFQLDEYVGLPPHDPRSYRAVIAHDVAEPLGLAAAYGPDGMADDIAAACRAYEQHITDAGGIDLQLLGIGSDGHIGFNEPGSSLGSRTRIKTLTEQTRRDNARFFDGDVDAVPRHVVTQGIGTILDARHVVLLAWGAGKATAVAGCVEGPVTAMLPASALQLHPHVTLVVDEAAAADLKLADYYRAVYAAKPDWQGI
jgi:glucosamine-6-phosphate deaminase